MTNALENAALKFTDKEWLEADGLGGFASGTAAGVRTRRYHGLLCAPTHPPTGRQMLVAGLELELELAGVRIPLSTQRYGPDVLHPSGLLLLESFSADPVPTWRLRIRDGLVLEQRLAVPRELPAVVMTWRLDPPQPGAKLFVRPLLAVRDLHGLQHERHDFRFEAEQDSGWVRLRPFDGSPTIAMHADGAYHPEPQWYKNFLYTEERDRGYDHQEDLAAPGVFELELGPTGTGLVLAAVHPGLPPVILPATAKPGQAQRLLEQELRRRSTLGTRLDRSAEAYLVRRGPGHSILAGYPWFADWGRDTFIAMRGLCLARGRLDQAGSILREWTETAYGGMLPNRFVDAGEQPEFNSVDASLWFVTVVGEYLDALAARGQAPEKNELDALRRAVLGVLHAYARGTRFGICMDQDQLLRAGEPGCQLTWMDAKVEGLVVTPRIGKPVEVQALWANALAVGARFEEEWKPILARVEKNFEKLFWNEAHGYLEDVVDVDHCRGLVDSRLRPNQILAIAGLPLALLSGERARRVVDRIEADLWTPLGLRSLSPDSPGYRGRYAGGPLERDEAYHQGTAWPWLLGPFVEAWVKVRGGGPAVLEEARTRFVAPLIEQLDHAGLGHISEVFDGDLPQHPGGCPFQAWSLGELLRLEFGVLATPAPAPAKTLTPAPAPGGRTRRQASGKG